MLLSELMGTSPAAEPKRVFMAAVSSATDRVVVAVLDGNRRPGCHTDSQNPSANTQRRHPTNMHLAAHRAIAVRGTLRNQGVPASRMFVAGWGEHRPIIENNERGGTAENRRVELFLMRSTEGDFGSTASVPEPTEPIGTNTRAPGAGTEPVK